MTTRVKKEPIDAANNSVNNHANMFESPKKPSQYQLVVKSPESPKKKSKSKKLEQPGTSASCSLKKGKAAKDAKASGCKRQKQKCSESNKKLDRKKKTVIKVAKAMQKMGQYYANAKRGKSKYLITYKMIE